MRNNKQTLSLSVKTSLGRVSPRMASTAWLKWPLFQVTDQFAAWLIDLLVAVDCRSDCPNESFDWSEMKIYNT